MGQLAARFTDCYNIHKLSSNKILNPIYSVHRKYLFANNFFYEKVFQKANKL